MRRIGATVVALIALAGALVAGEFVPVTPTPDVALSLHEVEAVEHPVACPGQLEVPVGDVDSGDPDLDAMPTEVTRNVFGPGAQLDTEQGTGVIVDAPVAVSTERAADGDIAGLAALSCMRPAQDQWLIGGSTALNSSARLVLVNPGLASVDVTVTLLGPLGESAHQEILVIGAQSFHEVLLEGVEAEITALAVRVESSGAGVVAAIQDSRIDGIHPAGTDWITRADGPSDHVVLPGVGVPAPSTDDPALQPTATLRLLSPEGATVTPTLVTDNGIVAWGGTSDLELDPGVVVDVPIPSGVYGTIEVRSEGEVFAAAMTTVPRPAGEDFEGRYAYDRAWVHGVDVNDDRPRSIVAPGGDSEIIIFSGLYAPFVLRDAEGNTVAEYDVEPRSFAVSQLAVPTGTVLTAEGPFVWAVRVRDEPGFITMVQPVVTDVEDLTAEVQVGPYAPVP